MKKVLGILLALALVCGVCAAEGLVPVTGVEVAQSGDPLSGFSYTLSGDSIVLKSCKGSSPVVEVQAAYEVDGKTYKTDLSKFQVGIGDRKVETVIFGDGITEIAKATFNSCHVKKVFFPASMTNVSDYSLAYLRPDDGETIAIYYAGTQDDWAKIFTAYERETVSDAESPEDKGSAFADLLNSMIGMEYDSADFTYYFSATPDAVR